MGGWVGEWMDGCVDDHLLAQKPKGKGIFSLVALALGGSQEVSAQHKGLNELSGGHTACLHKQEHAPACHAHHRSSQC